MKKVVATILAFVMVLGLTGCSQKSAWSDADLVFADGSAQVEVEEGYAFIARESGNYLTEYSLDEENSELHEGDFATARGLEIGMTLEDYKELYAVVKNYAVWELYSGDNNMYTTFKAYTNQDAAEMYEEFNNVWLDLGYKKVNGKWQPMKDYEVQDAWFCDAEYDDFDEVIVFAVNLDEFGKVIGLSLEHFTYDEDWAEWQGWAE